MILLTTNKNKKHWFLWAIPLQIVNFALGKSGK
jgi:hypothetical protein